MLTEQTRFWIFLFFWNVITDHTTSTTDMYPYQKVSIEIDCVPEHGAGSSSWGTITGICNCVNVISNISEIACDQSNIFIDWSTSYSVVIYSITTSTYIQPYYNNYYTTISDLGLWSRRIHLGYEYEVDLVEFEDKLAVINTDSKDASEHDPECYPSQNPTVKPSVFPTVNHNPNIYPYQKVSIEIDCVPEHGAGASSWGMITGVCTCVNVISSTSEVACDQSNIDWSTSYSVVIYSVTNKHYIQPYYNDYYTTISDLGLWSRRIHLGYGYEVDLVEFEDKSTVINTDSRDATEHDPECISTGSTASNHPSVTYININPPVNSGNKIEVNNVSLFSVFLMLMVLMS